VEAPDLDRMLNAMRYRGTDGRGVWIDGATGLGHLLLHTTPESLHERQPVVRGDLALCADCRIDNRSELLAELAVPGPHHRVSDPALILFAYERWGEECVSHLLGDFAFGLWDGRRETMFCARDHFGVKPLYYHHSVLFAFASEIKSLLTLPEVPRELDDAAIADLLTETFDDRETTFYREVKALPAAHTLTMSRDGVRLHRYWSLVPRSEGRLRSDADYGEALREHFMRAVRCRLRSAFPVGVELSGGLDSASVACTARLIAQVEEQPPIHTLSYIFDHLPQADERPWIEHILAGGGLIPHFVQPDSLDPLGYLDQMVFHLDGVFYAPNLFMTWLGYAEAAQHGVRVLLTGMDGDSTLSHGADYPQELFRRGQWLAGIRVVRETARARGRSPWKQAQRFGLDPLRPARRVVRHLLTPRSAPVPDAWNRRGILGADLSHRIDVPARVARLSASRSRRPRSEREGHIRQLSWGIHAAILTGTDGLGAGLGIEVRHPFYDVRLAEFCIALPGDQKIRNGWTRWVMRNAMEGILPPRVQWRAYKSNLGSVLSHGLVTHHMAYIERLARDPGPIEPYIDVAALRVACDRFRAAPGGGTVIPIWQAIVLDRGLRLAGWVRKA
jgi:asparagine synthase (glutamine-hydrolysing)